MNNDDMSDEQFDAFLRGEDDLSRRLQGLTQPASSPKLDAAILGYVKAGLEQEAREAQTARPAAANDAVIDGAPPQLAPGLGRRWRIPAGIAAGVLAGVLGHQIYQDGGAPMEANMAGAPVAEMAAAPVAGQPAPAVAEQAPVTVAAEVAQPAPPVVMAKAAPVEMPAAPAPTPAPMPPQAPPAEVVAAAPPPPEPVRVEITGSAVKRKSESVSAAPANVTDQQLAAAPQAEPPVVAVEAYVPAASAPAARFARTHPLARTLLEQAAELKPEATDTPEMHAKRARDWLSVIDAMLKAGMNSEALAEWSKFRAAYPDYPVSDQMLARIAAIKR